MKAATIIFLLLVCLRYHISAQTEPPDYKVVTDKFVSFYNRGNYGGIFAMYDSAMQKFSPLNNSNAFFEKVRGHAGQITSSNFQKYSPNKGATYQLICEKTFCHLNIAIDRESKISGFTIIPYPPDSLPKLERNITPLELPFKGEWTVAWGGDTKALNNHFDSRAQKKAFDIVITDKNGKTCKRDGSNNKDYYAYAQKIIAPCDGEVVLAVDNIPDNKPGELNPAHPAGNSVMVKTANNEYLLFAHLKLGSAAVRQGDKVKRGDLLGQCGNSGNSSEPHLHFHIQNVEDMDAATGVKCYFENLLVNGTPKTDYSPVKGDKIEQVKK